MVRVSSSTAPDARRPSPGLAWVAGMVGFGVVVGGALVLTGCPTVDLGDDPPDPGVCRPDRAYFDATIWPQYLAPADEARSCVRAGCHGDVAGVSALRLDSTEPIDLARNYQVATRFLNCGTPAASLLYTKPLGGLEAHGGGDIFVDVDAQAAAFLSWFP
jgi:hypothetical protein